MCRYPERFVMKSSRYVLTVLFLLFAVPLLAQVNDTYVIPTVANTPGLAGSRWSTELNVFNPQSYELKVSAIFIPSGGGAGDQFDFRVPANSNAFTTNLLDDFFDRGGIGSLLIATFPELNPGVARDVISRSFLVTTKTFNNASNGTFGQGVPGIFTGLEDYQFDGISAVAHGVRNFGVPGLSGFRANVGAANLGRYSVTMHVSVFDAEGRVVADRIPFTIPPQGQIQDRLPVQVDHGSIEFTIDDPTRDAVVFPYVTVTDNRSNGPVYLNPVLLASASSLYFKSGSATEVGRKIDLTTARALAANVASHRTGSLRRDENGVLRITRDE